MVRVFNNKLSQGSGAIYQQFNPAQMAMYTYTGNNYFAPGYSTPFMVNPGFINYSQWVTYSGEAGSSYGAMSFLNPNRTIATYMTSLGMTATLVEFLNQAKLQSRNNWRTQFTPQEVNCYIRNGFRTPIIANYSHDTTITAGNSVTLRISNINRSKYSVSWDGGLTFTNSLTRIVTPSVSTSYSVIIADSAELWLSCSQLTLHTFSVTVTGSTSVTLNPFSPVCVNTPAFTLTGGSPSGGVYSGTGVSGGMFNPAIAGVGTFTISYTYNSVVARQPITVNALPVVTLAPFSAVCNTAAAFALTGGSPVGGTYSGIGVSGGYFNPAVGIGTFIIYYTYTNSSGCRETIGQPMTVKKCKPVHTCRTCTSMGMVVQPIGNTNQGNNNTTGIDPETENNYYSMYPNPTSGIINIEFVSEDNVPVFIKLIDALGNVVYQNEMGTNTTLSFDLNSLNLSSGIYHLNMITGDEVINQKINFVR